MILKKRECRGVSVLVLWIASVSGSSAAQDLLVDQASGTTNELVGQFTQIPDLEIAQSFTPSLSAVGFVQFQTYVFDDNNGAGVVFSVNLREGAYNGPIVSSTTPVLMQNKLITQLGTFYYPDNIPVTVGQHYFFEPVLLSPGSMDIGDKPTSTYAGGEPWVNGGPSGPGDFWFREGIVVPEPGTFSIALLGFGALVCHRRLRRKEELCL